MFEHDRWSVIGDQWSPLSCKLHRITSLKITQYTYDMFRHCVRCSAWWKRSKQDYFNLQTVGARSPKTEELEATTRFILLEHSTDEHYTRGIKYCSITTPMDLISLTFSRICWTTPSLSNWWYMYVCTYLYIDIMYLPNWYEKYTYVYQSIWT